MTRLTMGPFARATLTLEEAALFYRFVRTAQGTPERVTLTTWHDTVHDTMGAVAEVAPRLQLTRRGTR